MSKKKKKNKNKAWKNERIVLCALFKNAVLSALFKK